MLTLDITKHVRDFLNKLDAKRCRQVANKIFSLMEDPKPSDTKELSGFPYRRADVGEYRIIYRVQEDCLKVALIGKRNDDEVYKKLRRLK